MFLIMCLGYQPFFSHESPPFFSTVLPKEQYISDSKSALPEQLMHF